MAVANLPGGPTASVTASFTGYKGVRDTFSVPTGGNTDKNGNKPVLITSVRAYVGGYGGSDTVRFRMGSATSGYNTSYFTVSSGTATLTGYKTINAYYSNGGTSNFYIENQTYDNFFYFGRDSSGTSYQFTTSYVDTGTTFGGDLSGDFNYFYVPTAPSGVTLSQANQEIPDLSVSWTAPSSDGGSAITGYRVEYSTSSTFATYDTKSVGVTTSTTLTGLTPGLKYYVRVAALNAVTTAGNTWSAYSASANFTVLQVSTDLDGWATFGTVTGVTRTISRKSIVAIPAAGLALHIEGNATATGGSYTTGTTGISRTLTGLTIGRDYTISGKAVLTNAAAPVNIYRFAVTGIGNGSSVTLSGTSTLQDIPDYTFTATATSHVIEIEAAENYSVTATGVTESVAFDTIQVTRNGTDIIFRLQDTIYNSSLVDHFDLATRSVGAYWWVNKENVTQFIQDYSYNTPIATFSDESGEGLLHYTNIATSFDTRSVVNDVTLNNFGTREEIGNPGKKTLLEASYNGSDATSKSDWGPRRYTAETNLYTSIEDYNFIPNPTLAVDATGWGIGASAASSSDYSRVVDTDAPNSDFAIEGRPTASITSLFFDVYTYADGYGIPIVAGEGYRARIFIRNMSTTYTFRARLAIRYYDIDGATISTTYGSYTTLSNNTDYFAVTRNNVNAPANAAFASLICEVNNSGSAFSTQRFRASAASMVQATAFYFDGASPDNANNLYEWLGTPGQSASVRLNNILDDRVAEILAEYAEPSVKVRGITWNAAENPEVAGQLDIGQLININFQGTEGTYRIVGMSHDISPYSWTMDITVDRLVGT